MMKQKKIIYILFAFLFLRHYVSAQQDALYNEYMFNHFVINPAYSGVKDAMNITAFHRSQWVGFSGAPQTESLSAYSTFGRSRNSGAGLQVLNDRIGSLNTIGAFGSYSYKIPVGAGKLSFGLRGGIFNYSINKEKLDYKEKNDPSSLDLYNNKLVPSFDFGMYYYAQNYFMSFSGNHLFESKLTKPGELNPINLKRHYFGMIGYSKSINDNLILKPFVMLKYVKNAPTNIDFNVSFLLQEKITLGLAYRTSKSIVLNTAFNIKENIKFGYAFAYSLTSIQPYSKFGSHEIFFSYELKRVNNLTKINNPRY